MLSIILLILKIIGITLLVLLGLLLIIIILVLFMPIRYRVIAEHGEKLRIEGNVGWLLHIIGARVSHLNGELHIRLRVFWFTLYDNLKPKQPKIKKQKASVKKEKKRRIQKKKKTKPSQKLSGRKKQDGSKDGSTEEKNISKEKNASENKTSENGQVIKSEQKPGEKVYGNKLVDPAIKTSSEKEKITLEEEISQEEKVHSSIFQIILHKIRNLKDKIIGFFRGIKNKIVNCIEKVKDINHKVSLITDFIKDELNKEGFKVTYASLKKLLKHILPTKLRSRVVFGTGDPCSTGQALGVIGILYSFYGDKIQITPDFENKVFEGKHYARGRIRLVTILIIVIKLILNKKFKQLKCNFQILKEAL